MLFGWQAQCIILTVPLSRCCNDFQEKFDEAESLSRRSLAVREKNQGLDHSAVAASLDSLAGIFHAKVRINAKYISFRKLTSPSDPT